MDSDRSAKKAARKAERRGLRNRPVRSALKTFIRKAELLIETQQLGQADAAVLQAIMALDKAAQKGVIHRNNAANRKSRLMQRYNAAKVAAAAN